MTRNNCQTANHCIWYYAQVFNQNWRLTFGPKSNWRLLKLLVQASWIPRRSSVLTPLAYQTHILWALSLHYYTQLPECTNIDGNFFLGRTSGLDAFSPYHLERSCPAMPCRTTGTPEAPTDRSSRTWSTFPSNYQHSLKMPPYCLATY